MHDEISPYCSIKRLSDCKSRNGFHSHKSICKKKLANKSAEKQQPAGRGNAVSGCRQCSNPQFKEAHTCEKAQPSRKKKRVPKEKRAAKNAAHPLLASSSDESESDEDMSLGAKLRQMRVSLVAMPMLPCLPCCVCHVGYSAVATR